MNPSSKLVYKMKLNAADDDLITHEDCYVCDKVDIEVDINEVDDIVNDNFNDDVNNDIEFDVNGGKKLTFQINCFYLVNLLLVIKVINGGLLGHVRVIKLRTNWNDFTKVMAICFSIYILSFDNNG